MKERVWALAAIILTAVLILSGCGGAGETTFMDTEDGKEICNVIYKGLEALSEENAEKYLETCYIDEEDSGMTYDEYYQQFKLEVTDTFEFLDLHYEAEKIDITMLQADYAEAEVTMTTVDTAEDSDFENIRSENHLVFTKQSGEWLVLSSAVLSTEPIYD